MNEKTVWISPRQWETTLFWIERQNIKNYARSLTAGSMTAHDLILEVGEKGMLVRADWKKELKKRYLVPPPVDGIYTGENVHTIAGYKAKTSRQDWVVWIDKRGEKHAAKLEYRTVKLAMLAVGTQGEFWRYSRETWAWVCSWQEGVIFLANLKAGTYY